MITLYVLLLITVSVFANEYIQESCSYNSCWPLNPSKYSNCKYLQIYGCGSDLKIDIFPSLPALEYILMTSSSISELQKYQFENVMNLNHLQLHGNSIQFLYNETFYKLSRLRELELQKNLIEILPEGIFNPLESLYYVDLSSNNISILPKDTFLQNRKLQRILLSGNPLKTVSLDSHSLISALGDLTLNDCGELRDLRLSMKEGNLHLSNSGVERLQITGTIQHIYHENSKVTRADLSRTSFKWTLEYVLCDMPSLEWLDLSYFTKSPDYFYFEPQNGKECKFPNLSYLSLSGNKLKYISRMQPLFGPNLITLDLSNNLLSETTLKNLFNLDTAKEEEAPFPNLRFLHMARNKLKSIPRNFPLFGPNLTVLDLSYNLLEDVTLVSLAKADNLQSLSLEGNRLTSFDYLSVCNGLKNLKRLALYDNMFNATFYRNMTKYLEDKGLQ